MASRWRALARTFGFWVGYFWVARLLFLWYHHRLAATMPAGDLAKAFWQGFRLDASGAAYLSALPAALLVLSTIPGLLAPGRWWYRAWMAVAITVGSILIAADLEIFRHWDHRIDATIVAYLQTPAEALASTGGTPRGGLALLALALASVGLVGWHRLVWPEWQRLRPLHPKWLLSSLLLPAALVIPARGGIQEIPVNQSSAVFSPNSFANEAAENALWSLFDSLARGLHDRTNPYLSMHPDSAIAALRDATTALAPPLPSSLLTVPRPNVVVIVWESASARAFGSLGGLAATPRFDTLAKEGILFRQFYAAGDRTDKGLAAILSGYPGLPDGSVMKTPSKAAGLPKIGQDFGQAGYVTSFYYGGELEFASLRSYLVQSGFGTIVGKADFPRASWNSKWGAHDGVVADRLLADLDVTAEPFFATWLTLSSHEPFETPTQPRFAGTDWLSQYLSSMAYTDEVLGDWIDRAKTRPWWNRTLVVIVADHGRRVVPLDQAAPMHDGSALFRIPMLWLGGALAVRDSVVDQIGSQLDVAPTLAALAGIVPARPYPWGRSLLTPARRPFAYYGFQDGFGIVTGNGNLVYDHGLGRVTALRGTLDPADAYLGRALLQLTFQDFLDR